MRYFKILLLFLFTTAIVSCDMKSSDEGAKATQRLDKSGKPIFDKAGELNIAGEDVVHSLITEISKDFVEFFPNTTIQIKPNHLFNTPVIEKLNDKSIDVAITSIPVSEFDNDEFVCVTIAQDALVFIINFNNNALQTLVRRGISYKALQEIFKEKSIFSWAQIHPDIKTNDPLKAYIPNKNTGAAYHLAKFIDADVSQLKGSEINSEFEIFQNIINSPAAIGLTSYIFAYNMQSKTRHSGIYVVPIDFDNSISLSNEELIYDDLDLLIMAIKGHLFPKKLVRNLSLVYRKDNEDVELIEFFIEHILEKQDIITGMNFIIPPNYE